MPVARGSDSANDCAAPAEPASQSPSGEGVPRPSAGSGPYIRALNTFQLNFRTCQRDSMWVH